MQVPVVLLLLLLLALKLRLHPLVEHTGVGVWAGSCCKNSTKYYGHLEIVRVI